jgi:hypothetical protein
MFCENLQFNLSLYSDDVLTDDERLMLDEHLAECPLCRIKLAEYQHLRQNLRVMVRPQMPQNLLNNIRTAVASVQQTNQTAPIFVFKDNVQSWWRTHLMSYSIGTFASLLLGFALLWGMFPKQSGTELARFNAPGQTTVMLADDGLPMTSSQYADSLISYQAPTINPASALAAMSKSIVRGKMEDDEVVVVADVFGNGLAQIAEVVEPRNDRRAVRELEKALKTDPAYAPPFVTAADDNRSGTVRVILKIQTVDVPIN